MTCLIIAGGILQDGIILKKKLQSYDYVIAVDHGYNHAQSLDIAVDIVVGDLDSVVGEIPIKTKKLNPRKDQTDLRVALDFAQVYDNIDIICATGGRLDHFMANISLLELFPNKNIRIIDEQNIICYIDRVKKLENVSHYLSIIPITEYIVFSASNVKYPANHLTVWRQEMISVSNESTERFFCVEIHQGKALLIQSD